MLSEAARRFAALPTAAKLLLILTAALLPIGLGLVWIANEGIREANDVLRERATEQSRLAARGIESLVSRNALALRIAANGRIGPDPDPCGRLQRALAITPAVAQQFRVASMQGEPLCEIGDIGETGNLPLVAPGDIALRVSPSQEAIIFRAGVIGGMATGAIADSELQKAASIAASDVVSLSILDGDRELQILPADTARSEGRRSAMSDWPIANGQLVARVGARVPVITAADRLVLLLPVLMWVIAAMITWLLVSRLLIRPLRRLQRSVSTFQPGDTEFILPQKLGPATEILELRDAFARAVYRVERSETEMGAALEGQRRLVREVHHRVKNNLQVVASLLSIHGRSADSPAARDAYAAISRRVGALSIVHRNHFAEMEENRGIALRPLLSELTAELRAGAPETARALRIDLDLEPANTTQDVAVSVAFLATEMIEYAMLNRPDDPIDVALRRSSELTCELSISSAVLVPEEAGGQDKIQFERIISGLAKQLRSDLERKLGRYSVDLPVFPPR
jgi:two-component sensor histidine kinase